MKSPEEGTQEGPHKSQRQAGRPHLPAEPGAHLIAEPETKPTFPISQFRNLFTSVCFGALGLLILRAKGQVLCFV